MVWNWLTRIAVAICIPILTWTGASISALTLKKPAFRFVKIGNEVLVGSGATVLQGIEIGDHAIIAAGAVVTKNVTANSTVIGVPAKPLNP